MARDVYLVKTLMLMLSLSFLPHYGSASGFAPARRDGIDFFDFEDPAARAFAETHEDQGAFTVIFT